MLNKHLLAYEKEPDNSPRKKQIEEKSKKRGKFGWHIGKGKAGRELKLPKGISYEEAIQNEGNRELLYQHVRSAHWHIVRYGPKKSIR